MQMRVYTINKGKLADFVKLWQEKIYPIRVRVGFTVPGAWTNPAANQFIWLMAYAGPEDWQVKDQEYFNSPERKGLDPNPADWIARIEEYFVEPIV